MFNIIPLALIFISISVIVYIIIRKFPQLSNIKTATIRSEKESEVKKKILDERIKRKAEKGIKLLGLFFKKAGKVISDKVENTKEVLEEQKKELEKEEESNMLVSKEDFVKKEEIIEQELDEAEEFAENDNFEKAEAKFIEVISKDPKNLDAYDGLAELYVENKMYNEGRETYSYILKLNPQSAKTHYDLYDVDIKESKIKEGLVHLKKAHELEAKNPKYIAELIEVYITLKDKVGAQLSVQKLKKVNPENAKIEDYEKELYNL